MGADSTDELKFYEVVLTCSRCKSTTKVIVDDLCLKCRNEVVGPGNDRETPPVTITFKGTT